MYVAAVRFRKHGLCFICEVVLKISDAVGLSAPLLIDVFLVVSSALVVFL